MFPVKEVTEAILALRRRGYSSYLVTNRTGSSSPPIHTRLDTSTHQLVARALAHRGQKTSPGFTLWSPLASHGVDELMREAPKRTVLVLSFGRPSCSVGILSKGVGGDIFFSKGKSDLHSNNKIKFSYLFKF